MSIDIKKLEAEALAEVGEERSRAAKNLIKTKLGQIANAKKVLANLEDEYQVLLKDIAS